MSLEQEIKQKEFESDYQKVLINLIYTNNYVVNKMNLLFKPHNITRQQYNVLRILRGQHPNPSSVNLIKERMLDKMSDASRIVERLRIKGLITRKKCDDDKRAVEIFISDHGLDLLEEMDKAVHDFTYFMAKLDENEINTLNQLLDKIRG